MSAGREPLDEAPFSADSRARRATFVAPHVIEKTAWEGKSEALVAGVSVGRIVLGARHSRALRAHGGAAFGARLDRVPHKAAARGGGNPESSSRQHRCSETAPTGQFGIALNQTVKPSQTFAFARPSRWR